jgi:hypothetical protein
LDLFRQAATEVGPPAGAALVKERSERIARSLHMAVEDIEALEDAGLLQLGNVQLADMPIAGLETD